MNTHRRRPSCALTRDPASSWRCWSSAASNRPTPCRGCQCWWTARPQGRRRSRRHPDQRVHRRRELQERRPRRWRGGPGFQPRLTLPAEFEGAQPAQAVLRPLPAGALGRRADHQGQVPCVRCLRGEPPEPRCPGLPGRHAGPRKPEPAAVRGHLPIRVPREAALRQGDLSAEGGPDDGRQLQPADRVRRAWLRQPDELRGRGERREPRRFGPPPLAGARTRLAQRVHRDVAAVPVEPAAAQPRSGGTRLPRA